MRLSTIIVAVLFINGIALAQMPATNIVLLEMTESQGELSFGRPVFLTEFNKTGYNNQPSFVDRNHILFTSSYEAVGATDIYQMSLDDRRLLRMTATEESEYSPVVRGDRFTVVRQEQTNSDRVPQKLWSYPMDRSDAGYQAVPGYENIGYYQWLPGQRVAMFLLGRPMYMEIYDVNKDQKRFISNNPGRSFQFDGQRYLYYIIGTDDVRTIRRMDITTDESEYVTRLLGDSQDYVLGEGALLTGSGSKIYRYDLESGVRWQEVSDMSGYGINDISRMTMYGNRLAIVVHQ